MNLSNVPLYGRLKPREFNEPRIATRGMRPTKVERVA